MDLLATGVLTLLLAAVWSPDWVGKTLAKISKSYYKEMRND